MSYLIRQGAEVLGEHSGTGGNPDRWRPICEDVEANFRGSDGVPRAFRGAMGECVRWETLWSDNSEPTSRYQILETLAEYDFEPPVR
jgi:hypothetical protein